MRITLCSLVVLATVAAVAGAAAAVSGLSVTVPVCTGPPFSFERAVETGAFVLSDGSGVEPAHSTTASLCYTDQGLYIKYTAQDSYVHNPYSACNDPLYEYDAVEVFVAPGLGSPPAAPVHYLEVEVSPSAVLFEKAVRNPDDTCAGMTGSLLPCNATGIVSKADIGPSAWSAAVFLPFSVIAPPSSSSSSTAAAEVGSLGSYPKVWHMNMFRIDMLGPEGPTQYQAWSETGKTPPCFHVPSAFGTLFLEQDE